MGRAFSPRQQGIANPGLRPGLAWHAPLALQTPGGYGDALLALQGEDDLGAS
jgi:hypothetical protein